MTGKSSQLVPLDAQSAARESRRALFGMDSEALATLMTEIGEPGWRAGQLTEALYRQRITELDTITTLPKTLRRRLRDLGWVVGRPKLVQVFRSVDGTERLPGRRPGQPDRRDGSGCRRVTAARLGTGAMQRAIPPPFGPAPGRKPVRRTGHPRSPGAGQRSAYPARWDARSTAVLPYGEARLPTQFECRGDCRAGRCRFGPAGRRNGQGSRESGLHGHGRAVP